MSGKPFLGPLRDEWTIFTCGFMRAAEDVLHCNRDAAWHGFVIGGTRIEAMMMCCGTHRPLMELSADYVHPLAHPCGIPGSVFVWPENYCVTEWDEAELLAAVADACAAV